MAGDDGHTFPVEVIEHIVDCLSLPSLPNTPEMHHGRLALLECALVCHGLYSVSRRALFRDLVLVSVQEVSALARVARVNGSIQRWLGHTRTVNISRNSLSSFAMQFAGRLPQVSRLSIFDPSEPILAFHPFTFPSLSSFHTVNILDLYKCHFQSFAQLQRLVRVFPNLSMLRLRLCSCKRIPARSPPGTTPISKPCLTTYEDDGADGSLSVALNSWLSRTPSTTQIIRSLSVPLFVKGEEGDYELYNALGPSLTDLRFTAHTWQGFTRRWDPEHGTFTFSMVPIEVQLDRYRAYLSKIVFGAGLHTLVLPFYVPGREVIPDALLADVKDWEPLDQLIQKHFINLQELNICVCLSDTVGSSALGQYLLCQAALVIEQRLPMTHRRGILRVSVKFR